MDKRENIINEWLGHELGYSDYDLAPASADASFRRYFRVSHNGETWIVMDAPPELEDCRSFVDITSRLRECDVNAPVVHAADFDKGLVLLDDLGSELYLDVLNNENVDQLYGDAFVALHRIQAHGRTTGLPLYDEALLRREMMLFSDWLLQSHLNTAPGKAEAGVLERAYGLLVESAMQQPTVFVHRDFHSRNLMHTRTGNPGIIDYQDAVLGPVTYDLVSLLKDCYIKWPPDRVRSWSLGYLRETGVQGLRAVSEEQWLRWFDFMGVQRQLKASGIFARLCHRDDKPGFLKDVPRTLSYITGLTDAWPELGPLADIINDKVLPALEASQ